MYVCLCKAITEGELKQFSDCGEACAAGLIRAFGLDDEMCCGRCAREIDDLVAVATTAEPLSVHAGRF
jgi:bacterioferritin-associated ferredoxin